MSHLSPVRRIPQLIRANTRSTGSPLRSTDSWTRIVLGLLVLSALALLTAPWIVPADYSPISNTTSESAAQGVDGAWLARGGFVLFGLAAAAVALRCRPRWGAPAAVMHGAFGLLMIAAGLFSVRPWNAADDYSRGEDALHSLAATAMGFAFAFGVLLVMLGRDERDNARILDLVAIASAALLPLGMLIWPGIDGVLQRLMFAVAYGWYALAAVRRHAGIGTSTNPASGSNEPVR